MWREEVSAIILSKSVTATRHPQFTLFLFLRAIKLAWMSDSRALTHLQLKTNGPWMNTREPGNGAWMRHLLRVFRVVLTLGKRRNRLERRDGGCILSMEDVSGVQWNDNDYASRTRNEHSVKARRFSHYRQFYALPRSFAQVNQMNNLSNDSRNR